MGSGRGEAGGDALPGRNDEHDTLRDTLNIPLEAGLVGVGERDVRERALGDRQHVVGAVEEAADFACDL